MTSKWRNRLLRVGRVLVIMVALGALVVWLLVRLLFGMMTKVDREIPSPDGKYKAVVWEADAGATTLGSTQVSILRESRSLSFWGGDRICFSQDGTSMVTKLGVHWDSSKELTISYDSNPGFQAEHRKALVNGITVQVRKR